MTSIFTELCVDCHDPELLARFWSEVLDYPIVREEDDDDTAVMIQAPEGRGPNILFITVPESKSVKNRLHIDVNPYGVDQAEEVERVKALGATEVDVGQGDVSWVVLADPEGNEFCILRTRHDD